MALPTEFRYVSMFSGIGGLDLGIKLAVPAARCVAYIEGEAHAAAVLVRRMEEGHLDKAPVWTDARTFAGTAFRGRVDCVVAGFPCPPVSVAGKQLGTADPRWLWPEVVRTYCETGARWLFVENVRGLLSAVGGSVFGTILADLARIGLSAEWASVSAADCGASQRRERIFLLAYAEHSEQGTGASRGQAARKRRRGLADNGDAMANARSGNQQ